MGADRERSEEGARRIMRRLARLSAHHLGRPRGFRLALIAAATACVIANVDRINPNTDSYAQRPSATARPPKTVICAPQPPGLIAWWPFDDLSESIAEDIIGDNDARHSTTLKHYGEFVGNSVTYFRTSDQSIVPDAPDIRVGDPDGLGHGSFSIEGWLWMRIPGGRVLALKEKFPPERFTPGWHLYVPSSIPQSLVFGMVDDTGAWIQMVSKKRVATNSWLHFAVSIDRERHLGRFFVDGEAVREFDISGVSGNVSNAEPLRIAPYGWLTNQEPMRLDEISLYDRALTQSDARSIHAAGNKGKCLTPCATICGIVFDDRNEDGSRQLDEVAIEGWQVNIVDSNGYRLRSTSTDAEGKYCHDLPNPPRMGRFWIEAYPKPNWNLTDPSLLYRVEWDCDADADSRVTACVERSGRGAGDCASHAPDAANFGVRSDPCATICGTTFEDWNGDGVWQEDIEPLTKERYIRLLDSAGSTVSTAMAHEGQFCIVRPSLALDGPYTLVYDAFEDFVQTFPPPPGSYIVDFSCDEDRIVVCPSIAPTCPGIDPTRILFGSHWVDRRNPTVTPTRTPTEPTSELPLATPTRTPPRTIRRYLPTSINARSSPISESASESASQ